MRDGDIDGVVVLVMLTDADTEREAVTAEEGRTDADALADGVATFAPHTARLSVMSTTLLPAATSTTSLEGATPRRRERRLCERQQ